MPPIVSKSTNKQGSSPSVRQTIRNAHKSNSIILSKSLILANDRLDALGHFIFLRRFLAFRHLLRHNRNHLVFENFDQNLWIRHWTCHKPISWSCRHYLGSQHVQGIQHIIPVHLFALCSATRVSSTNNKDSNEVKERNNRINERNREKLRKFNILNK
jgi:hypothetical protein